MEMSGGSRRPICGWETIGMEGDDRCCCRCCCGGEAGLRRQHTLITLLRQRETRSRRMARLLAAVLLLLVSAALALLVPVVLTAQGHQSPDSQPMNQPKGHSSGVSIKPQQLNPSAMLTAPDGSNTEGGYLKWESKKGNAHCHGGFNYSGGNLVVPRDGIYRVFLQITYESKSGHQCDEDELRLDNKVFRITDSYNGDVPFLSAVDTVSCSMEHWHKTIYTAGSFFLEANSRLRVKSTYSEHIVNHEYLVFFGAELLPQ